MRSAAVLARRVRASIRPCTLMPSRYRPLTTARRVNQRARSRRQDAGWIGPRVRKARQRWKSWNQQQQEEAAAAAFVAREEDLDDKLSFNDLCPLKDGKFVPPLRYSSVDVFAKGLGVLQAAGLPMGMAKFDLRGEWPPAALHGISYRELTARHDRRRRLLPRAGVQQPRVPVWSAGGGPPYQVRGHQNVTIRPGAHASTRLWQRRGVF